MIPLMSRVLLDRKRCTQNSSSAASSVSEKRETHEENTMASHCAPVGLLSFGEDRDMLRKQRKQPDPLHEDTTRRCV